VRQIKAQEITEAVKNLCMEANYDLGEDVLRAFDRALAIEESPLGKEVLEQLKENARIAREERVPMCQDTGYAVVFVELGQEASIVGGTLEDAINEGVRQGYREGYLRKSVLGDPIKRVNTGDNTPAAIHLHLVPGDHLKLTFIAKGGGCENMSALKMLKPADGVEGIKAFVVETVRAAGANPCPPVVVGVGIGGTFDMAALLAKKALLRPVGEPSPEPETASLEQELLERINNLGIGPQGFGGRVTALAVHVEKHACHIAGLPVAVNLDCHAHRIKEAVL